MNDAAERILKTVGRARRRALAAVLAESACLALAAGLAVATAAVLSGAAAATRPGLLAAALGALACGATWWLQRRGTALDVARRLDARLDRGGALACAWECARAGRSGALEAVLLEREARSLDGRAAGRAVAGPSAGFVAAPLVAAALLSVALERAPARPPAPVAPGGLATAADPRPARAEAGAEVTEPIASATPPGAAAGAAQPDASSAAPPTAYREGASSGETVPTGDRTADAATAPAAGAGGPAAARPGSALEREPGPQSSTLAEASPGSTMEGSTGPNRGTASTMEPTTPTPGETTPAPAAEAGTVGGRWWPARFDPIVRAWTAARAGDDPR